MNLLRKCRPVAAAILALLAAVDSAQAIAVADAPAPPNAAAVRASRMSPSSAAVANDSAALREGVITALNPDGPRVEIHGKWFKVVAGQTRFFQRGTEVTSKQLKKGSKVRFTLAPTASDPATLGVVYVP